MRFVQALVLPSALVGWFFGVASFQVYVLPWYPVYAVLNVVGLVLALGAAAYAAEATRHGAPGFLVVLALGAAVVGALFGASRWAFDTVDARTTCTVTEVIEQPHVNGLTGAAVSGYEHVLSCVDARVEPFTTASPGPDKGTVLEIAYDPRGDLAARPAADLRTSWQRPLILWGTGLATFLLVGAAVVEGFRRPRRVA